MSAQNTSAKHNWLAIIALILAGEIIFFLPFVLPRVFRPTLLQVLDITNFQLGSFFSVYGIVAMVSYFFGGPLADRFHAKYLMAGALLLTALGGMGYMLPHAASTMPVVYGFWGFTTIFLFWAALIRATREWGGARFQGRAFGNLEAGRGTIAALIGTLIVAVFSNETSSRAHAFDLIVYTIMFVTVVAAMAVLVFVPKSTTPIKNNNAATAKTVWKLLKQPKVYLNAIIICCAYVGYKMTDDFSLFANHILGFSEFYAAAVGAGALWFRPLFSFFAGRQADKQSASTLVVWCFAIMVLSGGLMASGVFFNAIVPSLFILVSVASGVYGLRGIYFALVEEANISLAQTGAAVGIISVVGYLPDVFASPAMGYLLDTYPGQMGHRLVFLMLSVFAVIGLLAALVFKKQMKNSAV